MATSWALGTYTICFPTLASFLSAHNPIFMFVVLGILIQHPVFLLLNTVFLFLLMSSSVLSFFLQLNVFLLLISVSSSDEDGSDSAFPARTPENVKALDDLLEEEVGEYSS